MLYVSGFLLAAAGFLLWLLLRDTKQLGKTEAEKEIVEATNEAITNIPLTSADLIARLRERAANERKDKPLS